MGKLFEDDWGVDNSPPDNTEITTTILYFSKEELAEFKKLAKAGIKKEFGAEFQQKGNLSDFLLLTLRANYGDKPTTDQGASTEEPNEAQPSGSAEGEIPVEQIV